MQRATKHIMDSGIFKPNCDLLETCKPIVEPCNPPTAVTITHYFSLFWSEAIDHKPRIAIVIIIATCLTNLATLSHKAWIHRGNRD